MGNDRNEPYLWRERWRCETALSSGATSQCDATASGHFRERRPRVLHQRTRGVCQCSAIAGLRKWERVGKMEPVARCALTRAAGASRALVTHSAPAQLFLTIVITRDNSARHARADVGAWRRGSACHMPPPSSSTLNDISSIVCVLLFHFYERRIFL